MAEKLYNTDINVLGKINTIAPNVTNAGAVLTWSTTTKTVSHRTNTQFLTDLGLSTSATIAATYYTRTQLQTSGQSLVHWGNISNKPNTVAGYGIVNAYTKAEIDASVVFKATNQTITGLKEFPNGLTMNGYKYY